MPPVHRFAEFVHDLQQLEKSSLAAQGPLILAAFSRHTPYGAGALYLRDGRGTGLKLAAKNQCAAPDLLADEREIAVDPAPHVVLPLKSHREQLGLLALGGNDATDEDLALARAGALFVSAMIANQRLLQDAREGDFKLKSRLLELESLYDIGLSIASTLNTDELADEILFRMISLTNARRAVLYLREGQRFKLFRSFGDVRNDFLDTELANQLLKEGEPLSFLAGNDCIFPECSAFVAVPIKGNNAVIGVLAAADRETREGGIGAFEANELRLLSLFANQVAIALENARLHREALEKQAMERELELAATMQKVILPKWIPQADRVEIAVFSRPAKQVGGDYHAFFDREGVVTMLVADVAGKSMPAALLVSALHAAVQLLFAEGRELGEIATELNRHIHKWSAENKFITMVMVSVDHENETVQYVNAGHNPAYLITNGKLEMIKSHGLPIGIMPSSRYMTQTRAFPKGSAVVLYSDGITEAEDVAGEEYENDRLEALLREHSSATAEELKDRIAASVDAFTIGAPQKDDQTIVIARHA
ncbi:MAG TPA: SpoIIE family protein phosphatase [Thermoanaerobaculia bacterium]|jgi:sigma-B regulation protein RsbU (phosphoserine phosphatase)